LNDGSSSRTALPCVTTSAILFLFVVTISVVAHVTTLAQFKTRTQPGQHFCTALTREGALQSKKWIAELYAAAAGDSRSSAQHSQPRVRPARACTRSAKLCSDQ
jgi:hypothetical protein